MGWILSLIIGFQWALADEYFSPLRNDETVPQHCEQIELGFFQFNAPQKFYVGREGALQMGFTFEYPIDRNDATLLWNYFRGLVNGQPDLNLKKRILAKPELKRDYLIIKENFEAQDFSFSSEGEVLEALAIDKLYSEFPENQYFITGGIEYHEDFSPQTIGEIDVLVANRSTCEAVAVGEVKLGTRKTLSKAREQLRRLSEFLQDHHSAGLGGDYKPSRSYLGVRRLPSAQDF